MNWLSKIKNDTEVSEMFETFLDQFGIPGLTQALQNHLDSQCQYVCKTKSCIVKLKIESILYLKIVGHDIEIHTTDEVYTKYGSLAQEAKTLSRYGFAKCNQSVLVSLSKIKTIENDSVILQNGDTLHLSRTFAPKLISSYISFI